jgi:hypothetical protein
VKWQQVKMEWRVRGEGEREREQQINGVREGALLRIGNGVGWKWPLAKKDT